MANYINLQQKMCSVDGICVRVCLFECMCVKECIERHSKKKKNVL